MQNFTINVFASSPQMLVFLLLFLLSFNFVFYMCKMLWQCALLFYTVLWIADRKLFFKNFSVASLALWVLKSFCAFVFCGQRCYLIVVSPCLLYVCSSLFCCFCDYTRLAYLFADFLTGKKSAIIALFFNWALLWFISVVLIKIVAFFYAYWGFK